MRKSTAILLVLLVVASGALSARPASAQAQVSAEQVKAAITKGVAYLRKSGVFRQKARYGVGMNALALLAMVHCGVPKNDPDVVRAANLCADPRNWMANTYHVGSVAAALAAVDSEKYKATIKKCAEWLVGAQNRDGGWRYQSAHQHIQRMKQAQAAWQKRIKANPRLKNIRRRWTTSGQMSDHSCTQFGLLGLRAAHDAGIPIQVETWKRAEKYLVDTQAKDGGWAYTTVPKTVRVNPRFRARYSPTYGSMTAAGLGSLYICGMKLHQRSKICGEYEQNVRVAKALDWLAKRFTVKENPGRGKSYVGYYLYALERSCAFSGRKYIGTHDWYAEGAAHLTKTQQANGSWGRGRVGWGGGADLDTVFNLLFLGKASASILIQKLEYGPGWNTDYYDADNLSKQVSREIPRVRCTWQVVRLTEPVESWLEAPILYITGHGKLTLTAEQRKKMREFCERGGTIVADACCSNRTFDRAFRAEMKHLFPDVPLSDLPEGHPAYEAPHRIRKESLMVWQGITTGCRTAVFYSDKDLSCAWDGNIHDPTKSVDEVNAFRLGVNVAAYAMGFRPLKDKLDDVKDPLATDDVADDGRVERGALVFAQLKHDGDWDPDPTAVKRLLHLYAKSTKAKVDLKRVDLEPTDRDKLYKYPLIYMTGHRAFKYKEPQVKALRDYLNHGGFLLADSCCGRPQFDEAFRELVRQIFPKHRLEKLPLSHKIFNIKHRIKSVQYRPILKQEQPGNDEPYLEAIIVNDRAVLVYSKYDFGCAFEGFPCAACRGVEPSSAMTE